MITLEVIAFEKGVRVLLKHWKTIAVSVTVVFLFTAWMITKNTLADVREWQRGVMVAINSVAEVDIKPVDAARQVVAFGESMRSAARALDDQGAKIRAMGEESERYRLQGEEARRLYATALRQRDAAIRRYESAETRTERYDCEKELIEAEKVLDALYDSGF